MNPQLRPILVAAVLSLLFMAAVGPMAQAEGSPAPAGDPCTTRNLVVAIDFTVVWQTANCANAATIQANADAAPEATWLYDATPDSTCTVLQWAHDGIVSWYGATCYTDARSSDADSVNPCQTLIGLSGEAGRDLCGAMFFAPQPPDLGVIKARYNLLGAVANLISDPGVDLDGFCLNALSDCDGGGGNTLLAALLAEVGDCLDQFGTNSQAMAVGYDVCDGGGGGGGPQVQACQDPMVGIIVNGKSYCVDGGGGGGVVDDVKYCLSQLLSPTDAQSSSSMGSNTNLNCGALGGLCSEGVELNPDVVVCGITACRGGTSTLCGLCPPGGTFCGHTVRSCSTTEGTGVVVDSATVCVKPVPCDPPNIGYKPACVPPPPPPPQLCQPPSVGVYPNCHTYGTNCGSGKVGVTQDGNPYLCEPVPQVCPPPSVGVYPNCHTYGTSCGSGKVGVSQDGNPYLCETVPNVCPQGVSTNPVSACGVTVPDDQDRDGASDSTEAASGSNADAASSLPTTDDDGDGTANYAEPAPVTDGRSACTGAYGVVLDRSCGGYASPTTVSDNYVTVSNGKVWVWDALCTPAASGSYAGCKASSNYAATATPLYSGTYTGDGYGWRPARDVPTVGPQPLPAVLPCNANFAQDNDGDGVPVYRFCSDTVTVYPDGHTTTTENGFLLAVGDPNDGVPLTGNCQSGQVGIVIEGITVCQAQPGPCPSGQVGAGSVCAPLPVLCGNGQVGANGICVNPTPGTCPTGQVGAVVAGVPVCSTPPQPPPSCPSGQVGAGGVCVTTAPCPTGSQGFVVDGTPICVAPPGACPPGQTGIGSLCVPNPTLCSSPQVGANGICVNPTPGTCPTGQVGAVVAGVPVCATPLQPPGPCPSGQVGAGGVCVTISSCPSGQSGFVANGLPVCVTPPSGVCPNTAGFSGTTQSCTYTLPGNEIGPTGVPNVSTPPVPGRSIPTPPVGTPGTCTVFVCTDPTVILPAQVITTPGTPAIGTPSSQEICSDAPAMCNDHPDPQVCAPTQIICIGPFPATQLVGAMPGQTVPTPPIGTPAVCATAGQVCLPPTQLLPASSVPIPGIGSQTTPAVSASVQWTTTSATVNGAGATGFLPPTFIPLPIVGGVTVCQANSCPVPMAPTGHASGTLTVDVTVGDTTIERAVPVNI